MRITSTRPTKGGESNRLVMGTRAANCRGRASCRPWRKVRPLSNHPQSWRMPIMHYALCIKKEVGSFLQCRHEERPLQLDARRWELAFGREAVRLFLPKKVTPLCASMTETARQEIITRYVLYEPHGIMRWLWALFTFLYMISCTLCTQKNNKLFGINSYFPYICKREHSNNQ